MASADVYSYPVCTGMMSASRATGFGVGYYSGSTGGIRVPGIVVENIARSRRSRPDG